MVEWARGVLVGRGSFGAVHLATVVRPGRAPRDGTAGDGVPLVMAVKSCPLAECATLLREKEVLGRLAGCPEVVACYGDDVTVEEDGRRVYNVLLEYVPGGTLSELCRRMPLPEAEVRRYAAAILRGLRRVHEAGYVHCDVKPQNVLVAGKGRVKIADFGLAKRAGEAASAGDGGVVGFLRGTPLYMAPESVERGEHEPPSDVWSLGCVVLEMATGRPAWPCTDTAALIFRLGPGGDSPEIPDGMSEDGKDFLGRCFVRDTAERWTATMLLEHPFVAAAAAAAEDDGAGLSVDDKSPRSIFEFPTWVSVPSPAPSLGSTMINPSPESSSPEHRRRPCAADRLRDLITGTPGSRLGPSSSTWNDPSWFTVREQDGSSYSGEPSSRFGKNRGRGPPATPLPESSPRQLLRPPTPGSDDGGEIISGKRELKDNSSFTNPIIIPRQRYCDFCSDF